MQNESKKAVVSEAVLTMWALNLSTLVDIADRYREMGDEKAAQDTEEEIEILSRALRAGIQ